MQLATIDIFAVGEEWAKLRRPAVIEMIDKRPSRLSDALGDKDRRRPLRSWRSYDDNGPSDHRRQEAARSVFKPRRTQGASSIPAALAAQIADFEQLRTGISLNLSAIHGEMT